MEVCTVSGYEESGKNMTAVKVGEDVVIFDAGVHLPPLVKAQDNEEHFVPSETKLRNMQAIPDDKILEKKGWDKKVRAIVISHAHLDHVGAIPYIAKRYPQAEILTTPFTMEFLYSLLKDENIELPNKTRKVRPNSKHQVKGKSGKLELEFIHATHSTIQCVYPVWHSEEGIFFYGMDLKMDKDPVMGSGPNYERLKELKKEGIKCMVIDSLYSDTYRKAPSEKVARDMLEDAIYSVKDDKDSAIFLTTFASHVPRLKSMVDFGKKTGRQIVFLGRSLHKYVEAANNVNQCPFYNKIKLVKYGKQVNSMLKKIQKNRGKYLVVCTGHQAEKGAILPRIIRGETPFEFSKDDNLIISSGVIPVEPNLTARAKMDKKIISKGINLQKDIHVSGHGSREDLRDMVETIEPENIIPAHGTLEQEMPMVELAKEMGYKTKKGIKIPADGKTIKI